MASSMHMAVGAGSGGAPLGDAHKLQVALRAVFNEVDAEYVGVDHRRSTKCF